MAARGRARWSDGVVAAKDGRILYAGPQADAPAFEAEERIDCDGRWITPGLIDCHTHLVYAGDRAREFEMRLEGATYEEIARAGGGIASTVTATRAASEAELIAQSLPRLDALIAEGATTVEIKSGYGLSLRTRDQAAARGARAGSTARDVGIVTTFLGAHALPPEADGDKDAYIDYVCAMIPAIARRGAGRCRRWLLRDHRFLARADGARVRGGGGDGLRVKLHADQLSNGHGAALAARYGALSADHLEHTDEAGIAAMAKAGTVAVLLPGAFYFLRDTKLPPVDAMRQLRRAHRARHRLQSRHLAADLVAADDEHGRDPVPADGGANAWPA